jgi:hypothetical protein
VRLNPVLLEDLESPRSLRIVLQSDHEPAGQEDEQVEAQGEENGPAMRRLGDRKYAQVLRVPFPLVLHFADAVSQLGGGL